MSYGKNKYCISCGMPLKEKSDYYKIKQIWTTVFTVLNFDGSMKSYEEMLASMIKFLNASHGLEEEQAKTVAVEMLKKQSAF